MNYLLAKVNDREEKYRKLLSDDNVVFNLPDSLKNEKEYDPEAKLEEDEWFVTHNFSQQKYCIDLLKTPIDTTSYKQLNIIKHEKIDYICSIQNGNQYFFQRLYKSSRLLNKKFVHLGDDIKLREAKNEIIINESPDALYLSETDCLYFRKLETISPIFRGIDILFKEATQEEIDEFMRKSFIRIGDKYKDKSVGKANRRRIAMAMSILSDFTYKQVTEVFKYTDEYYPDLKYDGEKFQIDSEDDLRFLLFGIEQRFYTTPVTKQKRVASAVAPILN